MHAAQHSYGCLKELRIVVVAFRIEAARSPDAQRLPRTASPGVLHPAYLCVCRPASTAATAGAMGGGGGTWLYDISTSTSARSRGRCSWGRQQTGEQAEGNPRYVGICRTP